MKDEKKKVTILMCLFAAVICVGAFQFMGHKRPPPVPDPKKPGSEVVPTATVATAGTPGEIKNPQFANDLPERDPFLPPADALPKPPENAITKAPDAPAPFPARRSHSKGFKPFDPLPGASQITPLHGSIGAAASAQPRSTQFRLVGVIRGTHPMALFADEAGNQKLVSAGGSIDGDTKLTGIEERSVSIDFRGQRRRLSMGGNPVGK